MSAASLPWPEAARERAFHRWLAAIGPTHRLQPQSLRLASADASFRRYFRVDGEADAKADGLAATFIIMDAPPAQEDCRPFVNVAALMQEAGVPAPHVLAWDQAQGFMLLTDLGAQTMMEVMQPPAAVDAIARPTAKHHALYMQAVDVLLRWQLASKPGVLPPYDDALLSRELALFPDWYVKRHRGIAPDTRQQAVLDDAFRQIKASNLNSLGGARVFVHRDFMPRNLMLLDEDNETGRRAGPPQARPAPSRGSEPREVGSMGALDFQDAVYGPITYDIASLMRDAFLSWEEDFVLDITVRYWEKARKAGLPVGDDFGEFYRAVEWMGLQRHLKILGIFARLTLRDGKPKYLLDAPRFIRYVRATCSRYRALGPLMVLLDEIEGNETRVGYTF
jgi:N-acetylmuramate 1-kinase